MSMKKSVLIFTACLLVACQQGTTGVDVDRELAYCHEQVLRALEEMAVEDTLDYTMQARNILSEDLEVGRTAWNLRPSTPDQWCSGFWPGILWYDYEYSGDTAVREHAERFTASLGYLSESEPYDHDLGFLVYCSYGNGMRLQPSEAYRNVIVGTSRQLAKLYNPTVGTILSWPREVDRQGWPHNTIMDNMMNLEMMFWAARNGGDSSFYDIAVDHAETTMEHHFREDGSCYHVAVYDTLTGDFIKGVTHQGFADHTMWARGQAWAIYGYTMVYRETRDPKFLAFAQKVSDVYLKRLPERVEDWIPLWDFDAPEDGEVARDASAACIVASALLELSTYVEGDKGKSYRRAAEQMLASLSQNYKSGNRCVSFLLHSTGHHPAGSEIDAAIVYADYYYIEALLRLRRLQRGEEVLG